MKAIEEKNMIHIKTSRIRDTAFFQFLSFILYHPFLLLCRIWIAHSDSTWSVDPIRNPDLDPERAKIC
jgi:hypothetical protein